VALTRFFVPLDLQPQIRADRILSGLGLQPHTRHRSVVNAMVNVLAALVAYTHQSCKPSLNVFRNELNLLTFQE